MHPRALSFCAAVAAAMLFFCADPGRAETALGDDAEQILSRQPGALRERLEEEKVVILTPEAGAGVDHWVRALAIFERPREEVMHLIAQSARQIEYRPEITAIETVEHFPNGTVDEHYLRILFVKLTYRLRAQIDYAKGRAWWGLDERFANDLRRLDGYWEFYELGPARTLGAFGTVVDIGPALPGFLQDVATRKNVPQTVDRTRRWVDSNGAWRP
jgi:hypothetical protein